jgi:hypothetical protein
MFGLMLMLVLLHVPSRIHVQPPLPPVICNTATGCQR